MNSELVVTSGFTTEQIGLIKRTICKGSTDDELSLFTNQCKRTGLDPFSKQIHAVMRWDSKSSKNIMSIQVGIDGFRLVAQRSGEYEGQTPVQWCDKQGTWMDVWVHDGFPVAAKVGVYRRGFKEPLFATALWSEYSQQYFKDNSWHLSPMWKQMPVLMLAKCAEALALRKAFPAELSGLYSPEEMGQADKLAPVETPVVVDKGSGLGNMVMSNSHDPAASAVSYPLPSATSLTSASQVVPIPVSEAGGDEKSRYRQLRADLNNALTNAGDSKGFQKAQSEFQKRHGKAIWIELTGHGKTETFDSLRIEHWERIKVLVAAVADGDSAKTFLSRLIACTDSKAFMYLESEYSNNKMLADDSQITEQLNTKGRELGVLGYDDLGGQNG